MKPLIPFESERGRGTIDGNGVAISRPAESTLDPCRFDTNTPLNAHLPRLARAFKQTNVGPDHATAAVACKDRLVDGDPHVGRGRNVQRRQGISDQCKGQCPRLLNP